MDNDSDTAFTKAERAGTAMLVHEPRARTARYDTASCRIVIDLVNGCTYAFPVSLVQDLQGVDPDALTDIQVDGLGFNLHVPACDVDLYVPALVSGIFGTRRWMMRELARTAGRTTSAAKASAARRNGSKGGRPRTSVIA